MFFFEYDITNLRVLCEWHNKTLFCLPCYLLSGWIIFAFILKSLVSWYIYYIIVCWFLRSNGWFFFSPNFVYLQAHAASAVLNFSENCTPDILTPYLDGIVSKLLVLLQVSQTNKQTKKNFTISTSMKLNNFFYTLLSYMHLAEWETNGARGCPDCFGISCRFISGTSWNNLVINFVASKWLSNTEGIRRSTSKNTMMRLCLTWKQSWWMPLTNQTACSEQNPWSALV